MIGASARYALSQVIPSVTDGFPFATLAVNLVGSFLLGIVAILSAGLAPSRHVVRPFLAVGVIGSFTTFSTFAVENVVLVDQGDLAMAVVYVLATLIAGLAAVRLGIGVARRIIGQVGAE